MNYCTQCGSKIIEENAKFCSNCGLSISLLPNDTSVIQSNSIPPKQKNKRKHKIILFIVIISILFIVSLVLCLIVFNPFDSNVVNSLKSERTLKKSISLLGTPCDDILDDHTFTFSSSMGITVAKKTTNNIFGIEGENVIFILPSDEYVTIVTWQSLEEVTLTEEQIEVFLEGMKDIYGEPSDTSDKNSYLWETNTCIINLQIDENDDSIYIVFGLNWSWFS